MIEKQRRYFSNEIPLFYFPHFPMNTIGRRRKPQRRYKYRDNVCNQDKKKFISILYRKVRCMTICKHVQ